MANEIASGNKVLVEFSENNILLVDPNKVYENGKAVNRLVEPENLTIYANLKARVVPRSKLITGVGIDSEVPESFVDVFEGEINFLKPGNKDFMTTQWTNTQTGLGSVDSNGLNQDYNNPLKSNFTGQDESRAKVANTSDGESFGIENITVTIKKGFIPQVNITFIDVRGQTLFEQGANSPYSAFFQLPYPLFNLILKGYYGKAVRYQLMLKSFNASFDGQTGNYIVSCSFIGRIAALLADITLQELRAAPYMFSKTYNINNVDNDDKPTTVITSKGKQILDDIYTSYKTLGLVPSNLPHLTLDELVDKLKKLETTIEKSLEKEDLTVLDDIQDYDDNVDIYRKKILNPGGWLYTYMDLTIDGSNHRFDDRATRETYYRWKKGYQNDEVARNDAIQSLKQTIDKFNKLLQNNPTFGTNGKSAIPVTISYVDFLAPRPKGFDEYKAQWFIFDIRGESFGEKIGNISSIFGTKRNKIEQDITQSVNKTVIAALGFKPTVRNLFAIIVAQADTFLRLMDDTHTKAFDVRYSPYRREAINGGGKNSLTAELPEENFIYPWPHYYIREESNNGLAFVSTYPGSVSVVNSTKAYDPVLWPEVDFVEEFFKAQKIKDSDTRPVFQQPIVGENWLPITSFDLLENDLYHSSAYSPFNYEIWDRSIAHIFFSGIVNRMNTDGLKRTLNSLSHFEALNIKEKTTGYFDLQEFLKNQNFSYTTFIDYLNEIAPQTSYQLLIRDQYNTAYIRDKINDARFSLLPGVDFGAANYYSNDGDITEDIAWMEVCFGGFFGGAGGEATGTGVEQPLETYPLSDFDGTLMNLGITGTTATTLTSTTTNISWTKTNLANGAHIGSYQSLNSLQGSVIFSKAQKMFSSYIDVEGLIANPQFYNEANWILYSYNSAAQDQLKDRNTTLQNKVETYQLFYKKIRELTEAKTRPLFLTEGTINYGSPYMGQVGEKQIISILNTPYFINALLDGIKNEINNVQNPYISSGYLFLNSLPLATLREKTIMDVNPLTYGKYISKVLNQVSAVHPLPYAWILKYGSIWHRYKTFVNTGTDILTGVWDNFNSNEYFNADNGLSHQYNLNLGPNNSSIIMGGEWTIGGNFTKLNVGFYPELNNYINYFVTGRLLYNGTNISGVPVTSNEINTFINDDTLLIKEANALGIVSNPTSSTSQDMNCSFWYGYYDLTRDSFLTGFTTPQYLLFPSAGGMKTQQLQFEVDAPQQLVNNPIAHNGAIRMGWGMSSYGFFEYDSTSYPQPYQYMKVIDNETDSQHSFDITNNKEYANIEELFDVFSPDILDVFETYFLNFCKKDSDFNFDLPAFTGTSSTFAARQETSAPTYGTLQNIIRNILVIDQDTVEEATDTTELSFNLGKAQLDKINTVVSTFLKDQLAFNFYNPKDINLRVLRTIVGDANYYNFGSYSKNLPPDISLINSKNSNPQTWRTLQLQIGFYSESSSGQTTGLAYSNSGSYVTDFFRDMNINFTDNNIILLRKVIRMYVTQRILFQENGVPFSTDNFISSLRTNIIIAGNTAQSDFLTQLFINLKSQLPEVSLTQAEEFENKSTFNTDENKLEQYLVFKTLNDKWISGENFNNRLLFKDFLFLDIANRDIGDLAILSTDAIKNFSAAENANLSLYNMLGQMLKGNFFNFLALPSYINFYGVTSDKDREISKLSTQDEANAVFGTHLEVDYLNSSPKFLCQYIGDPSTQLADLGPQTKYNSDSFFLGRTADNPLFSDCYDPQRCNKVVSFAVDFGIQNQGVFKSISLDQSEFKNTSESFIVTEMMAQSANDNNIMTQGMSLFNIYKSRSYSCKIEAMGNVCIQPTMYFTLRHVPMFNGPYIILDVEHQIQPNTMTTTFTGVRVPFHRLPMVENLVGKVNKSFINKIQTKRKADEAVNTAGGFNPEGESEIQNKAVGELAADRINMIIIHVTPGINYGADPIENINKQHKDIGFTGIGYHFVISRGTDNSKPDGTLYGGRPLDIIGAHTQGQNTKSLSIAMIANCSTMSTYNTRGGELPTQKQKRTLEDTILWLLFDKGLLRIDRIAEIDTVILHFRNDATVSINMESQPIIIPPSLWYTVIKGHNDFSNKRCPCFKVDHALNKEAFGTNLTNNLQKAFNVVKSSPTFATMTESQLRSGLLTQLYKQIPNTPIPTPYPNTTTWENHLK